MLYLCLLGLNIEERIKPLLHCRVLHVDLAIWTLEGKKKKSNKLFSDAPHGAALNSYRERNMNVFKKQQATKKAKQTRKKRSQIQPQPHRARRTEEQRMGWDETRLSIRHGCEGGHGERHYRMGVKKPEPDSTGTW